VQVTNQLPALEESGDKVVRWANQVLGHSWVTALELTSSRPMRVQGTKIQNRLQIGEFVKIIKLGERKDSWFFLGLKERKEIKRNIYFGNTTLEGHV
jgi:hypothetical protein